MKKYNWKQINESFFDDLEDDLYANDDTDAIEDIIMSDYSILYCKDTDAIVDYIMHKYNFYDTICNIFPEACSKAFNEKGSTFTTQDIDSMLPQRTYGSYTHIFNGSGFYKEMFTKTISGPSTQVTLGYEINGNFLFIIYVKFFQTYQECTIPICTWDENGINTEKVNKYQKALHKQFKDVFNEVFSRVYSDGLTGILKEIIHTPVKYKLSIKDIDRMKKIVNDEERAKLSGYEAINNLNKKIPRIAAWYIAKFGYDNVKELSDDMFMSWCMYKKNIVDDTRNLLNLNEIYIKDIVATIQSYK